MQTQPAARIAALVNLEMFGRESVGVPAIALMTPYPDLVPTIAALRAQLGPNFEPLAQWHADPCQLASASIDHASQCWWAGHVAVGRRLRLCKLGSAWDMARPQCECGPVSNGWMSVMPSRALRTDISGAD